MTVQKQTEVKLASQDDVVIVRQLVRSWAVGLGFSIVEQTKVITAASELARNAVVHGKGGLARLEVIEEPPRSGLRLTFEDKGPGIADIERAMQDGFTTGSGLGLGLGGSKRLSSEFSIESSVGNGTRVQIIRWKG